VRLSEGGNTALRLWLDGRTAKRLGLTRTVKPVVVGRASLSFTAAGTKTVYVKLGRTAKARIARLTSVTLTLRAASTDLARNTASTSRRTTLRR
jgi:hypothetical protein